MSLYVYNKRKYAAEINVNNTLKYNVDGAGKRITHLKYAIITKAEIGVAATGIF